jgi:uncharacterized membrane protein
MSELNNCCGTTCDKQLIRAELDERAELSARLFAENQALRRQLNDNQLEIAHCHAVCDELRQKLDNMAAQRDQMTQVLMDVIPALTQKNQPSLAFREKLVEKVKAVLGLFKRGA